MKLLIALALSVALLAGCATTQKLPPVTGLTKEQVQLERERLVAEREVRNQRWLRIGEYAGTTLIDVVGNWLKAKTQPQSGLKK